MAGLVPAIHVVVSDAVYPVRGAMCLAQ